MTTYTLFELNEYIRRIIALNLPSLLWVSGEIAQIGISRGHRYLSLVQKSEETGGVLAQIDAVLWEQNYRRLRRKNGKIMESLLQEGTAVLLQVKVDYHERYGLKLLIEDIDASYTLGQLELQRRQTLEQLQQLDLLDRNAELRLPRVLQRIALISSERAAGYQDYRQQLQQNPYGYQFHNTLFAARVQGAMAAKEMIRQLKIIQRRATAYDCIVIIRGGGAKLDLLAFDDLELCKAVAQCTLPVITGIGHEVDEHILDRVANTALKTPTAVAEFLIQRHLHFEAELLQQGQHLQSLIQLTLQNHTAKLQQFEQLVQLKSQSEMATAERMLNYIVEELPRMVRLNLKNEEQRLSQLAQLCRLLSPEATLKRGFSLSLKSGEVIRSLESLQAGDQITTILENGQLESELLKIQTS
ncbi:MAG: exodeoxyribonuclease VII large subunit [Bacteroidota bacterium]